MVAAFSRSRHGPASRSAARSRIGRALVEGQCRAMPGAARSAASTAALGVLPGGVRAAAEHVAVVVRGDHVEPGAAGDVLLAVDGHGQLVVRRPELGERGLQARALGRTRRVVAHRLVARHRRGGDRVHASSLGRDRPRRLGEPNSDGPARLSTRTSLLAHNFGGPRTSWDLCAGTELCASGAGRVGVGVERTATSSCRWCIRRERGSSSAQPADGGGAAQPVAQGVGVHGEPLGRGPHVARSRPARPAPSRPGPRRARRSYSTSRATAGSRRSGLALRAARGSG